MTTEDTKGTDGKVSDVFEARLRGLKANAKVRAIVMFRRSRTTSSRPHDRSGQVRTVRESARAALEEIDAILARFHGRRLAEEPDALGYIPVETTSAGIRALAQSEAVRGIIEDQPARLAM